MGLFRWDPAEELDERWLSEPRSKLVRESGVAFAREHQRESNSTLLQNTSGLEEIRDALSRADLTEERDGPSRSGGSWGVARREDGRVWDDVCSRLVDNRCQTNEPGRRENSLSICRV
jgi:hypothetical protein